MGTSRRARRYLWLCRAVRCACVVGLTCLETNARALPGRRGRYLRGGGWEGWCAWTWAVALSSRQAYLRVVQVRVEHDGIEGEDEDGVGGREGAAPAEVRKQLVDVHVWVSVGVIVLYG